MTVAELAVVALVTILGSTVQGSTGIGLGLVAGPALLTIDQRFVPGPLLLASVLVGCRHIAAERHNIDLAVLRRLFIGIPFGVVVAAAVLVVVEEQVMAIAIGVLVVCAAGALLAGLELPRTPRWELVGGAVTAFTGVTAALPGPPLVMTLHDTPGPVMRPTVAATALGVSSLAAVSLVAVGLFGVAEVLLTLLLTPFVVVGLVAARTVRPWLDRAFFRPVILCVALAGGAALILRNA